MKHGRMKWRNIDADAKAIYKAEAEDDHRHRRANATVDRGQALPLSIISDADRRLRRRKTLTTNWKRFETTLCPPAAHRYVVLIQA